MNLLTKRIVVTGAASGIGRALVLQLNQHGAHVLTADRDADGLRGLPPEVHTVVSDVSAQAGVDALFDHAAALLGGIDVFIANAGFAYYEKIETAAWDHWQRIFAVNTLAPLYITAKMNQLYRDQPYRVVITCSAMALLALPGYAAYGATKAALHQFADAYRYELDNPRKLLLVYPIGTRTNFFSASGAPVTFPTQTPDHVARCIVRGLQQDRQQVFTSITFRALMIVGRVMPLALRLWQHIELRRFRRWSARSPQPDQR
jgi:short-subunit dehydrogenase